MTVPHIRINGVRGWGTLLIGVSSIVRGVAYLPFAAPEQVPGALGRLSEFVPLTAYAVVWLVAGVLALVQAFRQPHPLTGRERDFVAVAATCAMWSIWGYSYLVDWAISAWHGTPGERSYLSAATYLGPAFLIFCWGMLGRGSKKV